MDQQLLKFIVLFLSGIAGVLVGYLVIRLSQSKHFIAIISDGQERKAIIVTANSPESAFAMAQRRTKESWFIQDIKPI